MVLISRSNRAIYVSCRSQMGPSFNILGFITLLGWIGGIKLRCISEQFWQKLLGPQIQPIRMFTKEKKINRPRTSPFINLLRPIKGLITAYFTKGPRNYIFQEKRYKRAKFMIFSFFSRKNKFN